MSEPNDKPVDCDALLAKPFTNEVSGITIDHTGQIETKCGGDCSQCDCRKEIE